MMLYKACFPYKRIKGIGMEAEELRRQIHQELSGTPALGGAARLLHRIPRKESMMRQALRIMEHHQRSAEDMLQMLEETFDLQEREAVEFLARFQIVCPCSKENKE